MVDYGVGNLFSLTRGLGRCGSEVKILKSAGKKEECDGIILPGVGNFSSAVSNLGKFRKWLIGEATNGVPILGICLGMQLLFRSSEEGKGEGLSFFKGNVAKLPPTAKVPHMGWNDLQIAKKGGILDGIKTGSWFYFVHSYYARPSESSGVAANTNYSISFPSVIAKDNIFGTQFHPEKSGVSGERFLTNFVNLCRG
ncbi:MAG: imidazole glycerol phosphate synthase subunit HisH [Nitrososphaerales archaeon]